MITDTIIQKIRFHLDANNKDISVILGVSQNTISNYMDKEWKDVSHLACGKKMLQLLYLVETLAQDKSLSPRMIKKVIFTSRYLFEGQPIDVATAIKLNVFSKEELVSIAEDSLVYMRSGLQKNKVPTSDSLYSQLAIP